MVLTSTIVLSLVSLGVVIVCAGIALMGRHLYLSTPASDEDGIFRTPQPTWVDRFTIKMLTAVASYWNGGEKQA